jgi:hypothetical protein
VSSNRDNVYRFTLFHPGGPDVDAFYSDATIPPYELDSVDSPLDHLNVLAYELDLNKATGSDQEISAFIAMAERVTDQKIIWEGIQHPSTEIDLRVLQRSPERIAISVSSRLLNRPKDAVSVIRIVKATLEDAVRDPILERTSAWTDHQAYLARLQERAQTDSGIWIN